MEISNTNEERLSVSDAASELGTTRLRLLMLLREGAVEGEQIDGEWYLSRASLDAIRAMGGPAPVSPSCKTSCTATTCGCK
ncbi:MAG: hypothetical protein HYS23_07635 [Geobacter sp.]|nr:hypothetical protein [Geobacter sp.]